MTPAPTPPIKVTTPTSPSRRRSAGLANFCNCIYSLLECSRVSCLLQLDQPSSQPSSRCLFRFRSCWRHCNSASSPFPSMANIRQKWVERLREREFALSGAEPQFLRGFYAFQEIYQKFKYCTHMLLFNFRNSVSKSIYSFCRP